MTVIFHVLWMWCALGASVYSRSVRSFDSRLPVMRRLHFAFCLLNFVILTSCSQPPTPIQVSHSGAGAYEAALATDEKGFAVAWYDTRDGNAGNLPASPRRQRTSLRPGTPAHRDARRLVRGESRAPRRRLRGGVVRADERRAADGDARRMESRRQPEVGAGDRSRVEEPRHRR